MYLKSSIMYTKGSVNSTLVDRITGNVYHLNNEATDYVDRYINIGFGSGKTKEEQDFLEFLKAENLLCETKEDACLGEVSQIVKDNSAYHKLFAWIEVTTQCNLQCLHCYNESSVQNNKALSLVQYYEIIDKLCDYGIKRIQLIGGEPLMLGESVIKKMIQYAYGRFESIELFTNGTLLEESLIEPLKKCNIKLALSVYSYSQDIHDSVTTVGGSHKRTIECIKLLRKYSIPYRVANVLMKGVTIESANTNLYELNPHKDILRLSGRGNIHLMTRELLKEKLITEERFAHPMQNHFIERIRQGHNCFSTKIYIGANGIVYPCVMERRFNYGSIYGNTLEELLKNSSFVSKEDVNECKHCEYRYVCFDCRPDSISEDIYAKPWYCTYNPEDGLWENVDQFVEKLCNQYSIC